MKYKVLRQSGGMPFVCATIFLDKQGVVQAQPEKGYEASTRLLLDSPTFSNGKYYDRVKQPKKWVAALPVTYHGSYLWVEKGR